ncbi:MAG: triphosphoribosyl-dephospho-CoA synthase [Planctomycetes bacterium]|nr:triphosphoribosyl-dephospho-CoA synthase [Planctomycetota bacterium]
MNGPARSIDLGNRIGFGERARWSIVQEASAIKAGNVHPSARFENMDHSQFVDAAHAIGEAIDQSLGKSLGTMVVECTQAMLETTGVNTSLGTILLLAPLVQYELNHSENIRCEMLRKDWTGSKLQEFFRSADANDCASVYRAIAACKPGGLGTAETMDVLGPPPESLFSAMQLAADRDDVALQYCNGYQQVATCAQILQSPDFRSMLLPDAIRRLQVIMMAERVDSLIARKCGLPFGLNVQSQAIEVLQSGPYGSERFESNWSAFDVFLRGDGNRRNPGTTADLIAAALYVASDAWI